MFLIHNWHHILIPLEPSQGDRESIKSSFSVHVFLQLLGLNLSAPSMASRGPWSSRLSQDLGPWLVSSLVGDCQKAAPKKKAHYDPKKSSSQRVKDSGPWSECGLGTPKASRSSSRNQGVDDSKVLGLWHKPSQKRKAASQGVDESKTWGPWSEAILKRHFSMSGQGASQMGSQPKKAAHVSLTKS